MNLQKEDKGNPLDAYQLAHVEHIRVPSKYGQDLDGILFKPFNFSEKNSYPLLLSVYGETGSRSVYNRSQNLWYHYLANQLQLIVLKVDAVGTSNKGLDFMQKPYKRHGQLQAQDFQHIAAYMASKAWIDKGALGIWGWSGGGYSTLMSMMRFKGPKIFKFGIAVAPNVDLEQYDTIYLERFMQTPKLNPKGYKESNVNNYVKNLSPSQNLLLIHGLMDDNVHAQQSFQLIKNLQDQQKHFEFMLYPSKNHALPGKQTRYHVFTTMSRFIQRSLEE